MHRTAFNLFATISSATLAYSATNGLPEVVRLLSLCGTAISVFTSIYYLSAWVTRWTITNQEQNDLMKRFEARLTHMENTFRECSQTPACPKNNK